MLALVCLPKLSPLGQGWHLLGGHVGKPSAVLLEELGWHSGHQSWLPPLQSFYMGWVSVNLVLTSKVFSSYSSFLPHRKSTHTSRASRHLTPGPILMAVCITEMVILSKYIKMIGYYCYNKLIWIISPGAFFILPSPLSLLLSMMAAWFLWRLRSKQKLPVLQASIKPACCDLCFWVSKVI